MNENAASLWGKSAGVLSAFLCIVGLTAVTVVLFGDQILDAFGHGGEPSPAVSPSASALAPPAEHDPTPEEVAGDADGVVEPEGFVEDVVTEADAVAGVAAAVEAMRAFTARTLPHEQWWAGLEPHLTPEAAWIYESTDPWKIPASQVTDDGRLAGAPDGTFLQVLVGTDAGQYRLEMVRQSVEHPWLVLQLHAPEGTK